MTFTDADRKINNRQTLFLDQAKSETMKRQNSTFKQSFLLAFPIKVSTESATTPNLLLLVIFLILHAFFLAILNFITKNVFLYTQSEAEIIKQ